MLRIVAFLAFGMTFLGMLASILSTAALLATQLVTFGCIALAGAAVSALFKKQKPPDDDL